MSVQVATCGYGLQQTIENHDTRSHRFFRRSSVGGSTGIHCPVQLLECCLYLLKNNVIVMKHSRMIAIALLGRSAPSVVAPRRRSQQYSTLQSTQSIMGRATIHELHWEVQNLRPAICPLSTLYSDLYSSTTSDLRDTAQLPHAPPCCQRLGL